MAKSSSPVEKTRAVEAGAALTEALILVGFVLCGAAAVIANVASGIPGSVFGMAATVAGTLTS